MESFYFRKGIREFAYPDLSPAQQHSFKLYLGSDRYPHFKAFAAGVNDDCCGWGWSYNKPKDAIETAMLLCGRKGEDCRIYAVGQRVVTNFSQDQLSNYLPQRCKSLRASESRRLRVKS